MGSVMLPRLLKEQEHCIGEQDDSKDRTSQPCEHRPDSWDAVMRPQVEEPAPLSPSKQCFVTSQHKPVFEVGMAIIGGYEPLPTFHICDNRSMIHFDRGHFIRFQKTASQILHSSNENLAFFDK